MKTVLMRFDSEAERDAVLAQIPTHASSTAMAVTAFEQVAAYDEPDPETGEVEAAAPAIMADGYWLLMADEAGADPLEMPEGIVAISPVFMGMS